MLLVVIIFIFMSNYLYIKALPPSKTMLKLYRQVKQC